MAKVSSGALDFMKIIKCSNLDSFLDQSIINSAYQPHERPSFMTKNSRGEKGGSSNNNNPATLTRKFDKLCVVGLGLTNDVSCVSGSDIFSFINDKVVPTVTEKMSQRNAQGESNNDPFAIVVVAGNEGFGLSPQIADKCHLMFKVPSYQQFPSTFNGISIRPVVDSLNVSNAVAISMNDIMASRARIM